MNNSKHIIKAIVLIALLTSVNTWAKAYKCEANGKTTYQQTPCPDNGAEMQLKDDFNQADYQAAQARLKQHNEAMQVKRQAEQAREDKQWQEDIDYYTLRARQSSAIADHRQANELRRQRSAIDEQNRLLQLNK